LRWPLKVRLLEQLGPVLPRPHSDVIVSSRHANMKELRGKIIDDLNQEPREEKAHNGKEVF
jgi:hypothetical protein